jgi:hypothetical protein
MALSRSGAFRLLSFVPDGPEKRSQSIQRGVIVERVERDVAAELPPGVPGETVDEQLPNPRVQIRSIRASTGPGLKGLSQGFACSRETRRPMGLKALRFPIQQAERGPQVEEESNRHLERSIGSAPYTEAGKEKSDSVGIAGRLVLDSNYQVGWEIKTRIEDGNHPW